RRATTRRPATRAAKRGPPMPALPAMAAFIPGFELVGWDGVMVPDGTPPDIVARLNGAFNAVLAEPQVRAELDKGGLATVGGTPEEFARPFRPVPQPFPHLPPPPRLPPPRS